MQAIGADDEIKAALRAALELHADGVSNIVDRGDAVVEDRLDPVSQTLEDQRRQLPAWHAREAPAGQSLEHAHGETAEPFPVAVDLPHLFHVIASFEDP